MKTYWHGLKFQCACGRDGTILEIVVNRDGGVAVNGLCSICGKEFSVEDNMANIIAKASVQDYLRYRATNPEDVLADFTPVGLPN